MTQGNSGGAAGRWERYADAAESRPPTRLAEKALHFLTQHQPPDRSKAILDLGCGAGRDSKLFIDAGYRVIGIDKTAAALDKAHTCLPHHFVGIDQPVEDSLDRPEWAEAVGIHAAFVLPFLNPDAFERTMHALTEAAARGSVVSFHLIGPEDDWANNGIVVSAKKQVRELRSALNFVDYDERIREDRTIKGAMKRWHLHEIVASKGRSVAM